MMAAKPDTTEERLRDILQWGEALARHIQDMTQSQFMADEKTQHATTKCIEAIGEAAKEILKADPDFDSRHPDLKLKAAARMRDRLTHGYREIDWPIVWTTSQTSVVATVAAAKAILAQRQRSPD
ncbi:MAG: HepT-like ribonuclease domain-containing protein [Bradyrhizobium sp.]